VLDNVDFSLFKEHPETKALFTRVHADNILSPEFEAHAERVIAGIDITIGLLDDPTALTAHLAHLKSQHDGRNIKPEYYTVSHHMHAFCVALNLLTLCI
jgi:hemoglobin-like flavoprotein